MAFKDKSLKAYTGDQPYIFLSYSHDDSDKAEEIVRILTRSGYRVWYDEGIPTATRFAEVIANRIDSNSCRFFIPLFSNNFLRSEFCNIEVNFARECKRAILPVYLERVDFSNNKDLKMFCGRLQSVYLWTLSEQEVLERIATAPEIDFCREPVPENPPENTRKESDDERRKQEKGINHKRIVLLRSLTLTAVILLVAGIVWWKVGKNVQIPVEIIVSPSLTPSPTPPPTPSPVEDFDFEASDDGVTITGYKGTGGAVVIPSEIGGKPVTSIQYGAFQICTRLTSVTIPDSVISIGDYAFWGCTGLTSVTIPGSVTSIGKWAFYGCTGLTSVMVPNNVTSIGYGAFKGCTGLTSVTIPDSVTSIGWEAFSGCTGLTSVTVSNNVTSIAYRAFNGCTGLTSVMIPDSVTSIGYGAFDGCERLKDVYYTGSESQWRTIKIDMFNDPLKTATIHYNTPKPTASP